MPGVIPDSIPSPERVSSGFSGEGDEMFGEFPCTELQKKSSGVCTWLVVGESQDRFCARFQLSDGWKTRIK